MEEYELNMIFMKINKSKDDFDLFVETGTYVGVTLNSVKSMFNKLISIEITDKYFDYASKKFANDHNVELIKGDSVLVLPELADRYQDSKIVFFLDGHWSAGDTGKSDIEVPLIEELKVIREKYNNEALIIIDDADLFEGKDPVVCWDDINETNVFLALGDRMSTYFYSEDSRYAHKKRLVLELKSK